MHQKVKHCRQADPRSLWSTLCCLLVLAASFLGVDQEAAAALLFPVNDRPVASPASAPIDVWDVDDQLAVKVANQQTALSLSTPVTRLIQVLEISHSEVMAVTWSSVFEVDQDTQRWTFSLLLQARLWYSPIQLAVRTVNLASSAPVVPVAPAPSSALLFAPALVGLLGVLLREKHCLSLSGFQSDSRAVQQPLGSAPCLLVLSADTAFSADIHKQLHQAGYVTRVTTDVNSTLTLSEQASPALLLVDRRVSDWDMLRTSSSLKRVPLITMAPAGSQCTEEQWMSDLDRGADSIYDFRDGSRLFVAKMRAALRRVGYAVTSRPVYQVGAVHLDADHHEVTIAGQRIPLSAKPFAILQTLMQAPSRVFSRSELVDRVWGPQFAVGEHTLDVHVHALRQHLHRNPDRRCELVTIKGVGFKLRAVDSGSPSFALNVDRSIHICVPNKAAVLGATSSVGARRVKMDPLRRHPASHVAVLKAAARRPSSRIRRRPAAVGHVGREALAG